MKNIVSFWGGLVWKAYFQVRSVSFREGKPDLIRLTNKKEMNVDHVIGWIVEEGHGLAGFSTSPTVRIF